MITGTGLLVAGALLGPERVGDLADEPTDVALPPAVHAALQGAGAVYHCWPPNPNSGPVPAAACASRSRPVVTSRRCASSRMISTAISGNSLISRKNRSLVIASVVSSVSAA